LSTFGLSELFSYFLGFLGLYELVRARTSQKSFLQGYRWVDGNTFWNQVAELMIAQCFCVFVAAATAFQSPSRYTMQVLTSA
jgi:hypothetical protein